ncbi:MAG: hypothetical protein PVF65_10025 [Sphingomonadales bacterium]|jgi:hypothetical protein
MFHGFTFEDTLAASHKVGWQIDDIIGGDKKLDFTKRFMPESLARVEELDALNDGERRLMNHIRGHEYLCIFGLVEEFILPFVLDHARPQLNSDDYRVRAFLQFASEEAKHIHLFKRFRDEFTKGFGQPCDVIGPGEAVAKEVLRHDPLAVALVILHVEWMTQSHYIDSVRDNGELDPTFKSLLKHHWMEEAQHAKLDTLMVEALADGRDEASILKAIEEYLEIGMFLDEGLRQQVQFNLTAFELATGWSFSDETREEIFTKQHQALRWTYLGSGMTHPKFRTTLGDLSPKAFARVEEVAPAFC